MRPSIPTHRLPSLVRRHRAAVNPDVSWLDRLVASPRLRATALWGFGFVLQCNVITAAIGLHFLHLSDMLVLAGTALVLPLLARRGALGFTLAFCGVIIALLMVSLLFAVERVDGENYSAVMTAASAIVALVLLLHAPADDWLPPFCAGMVVGCYAAIGLMILDVMASLPLAQFGLAFAYDAEQALLEALKGNPGALMRLEKAGGLWSQGNEAGPTYALAAACAGYLAIHRRRFVGYLLFLAVFLLSFGFTLNRSGLFAVCAVTVLVAWRFGFLRLARRLVPVMPVLLVAVAGAYAAGALDPLLAPFEKRLAFDDSGEENLGERIVTTAAGIEVMVTYPFGLGGGAKERVMIQATGLKTPHNGFIATALTSGLAYALALAAAAAYALARTGRNPFFGLLAAALTTTYFFEELNFNPVFMFAAGLLVAHAAVDLRRRIHLGRRHRAERAPARGVRLTRPLDARRISHA